jgi:hypothetical protein
LYKSDSISFSSTINLYRIDPPTVTEADKTVLLAMLNSLSGSSSLKAILENEIEKIYGYYLNNSLHDEHMPIDDHFDYIWDPKVPGKKNITIPFVRRPISVDIEKDGIRLKFDNQIKNDKNWKCSTLNLPERLDPK